MSEIAEKFEIIALGKEEFVTPYGLCGFKTKQIRRFSDAYDYISNSDLKRLVFLMDEDIIDDEIKVTQLEEAGANILILKGWGSSEMAERKIKNAAIKAIGTDIDIDKE